MAAAANSLTIIAPARKKAPDSVSVAFVDELEEQVPSTVYLEMPCLADFCGFWMSCLALPMLDKY